VIEKFRYKQLNGPHGSESDERFYNWCLTHSIGGITIAPRLRHCLRKAGVIYIQLYNMIITPYDANKQYRPAKLS
jgi:hypothetical protein